MFVTYKQAEIPIGFYLGDENTQHWQYVEQTLHCPWFYVGLARRSGEEIMNSMLLIPSTQAFEQLLEQQGKDIWLKDVQLVTPGYMNGSDFWKMELLLEICEVIDDRDNSYSYVYKLEGERLYSENRQLDRMCSLTTRVIFSAVKHLRS
ncbi:hypothetical protein D3C84_811770 [compost metagenome]